MWFKYCLDPQTREVTSSAANKTIRSPNDQSHIYMRIFWSLNDRSHLHVKYLTNPFLFYFLMCGFNFRYAPSLWWGEDSSSNSCKGLSELFPWQRHSRNARWVPSYAVLMWPVHVGGIQVLVPLLANHNACRQQTHLQALAWRISQPVEDIWKRPCLGGNWPQSNRPFCY